LNSGIEFKVVWFDQDVIELQVNCTNARFSGRANAYVARDDLPRIAEDLRGFPSSAADSRDFELGTFNPKHANGGIRMHFYCADLAGHALVEVKLRSDHCKALGEAESVALRIPVEASAIDSFVRQLSVMDQEQFGAIACLPMAGI
jgi:hypothetical protein